LAELGGVGLTPHQTAVDRALEAVTAVNETIDKIGATGELKAFNRAFKEARAVDPSIKYVDYLEAPKAWRPWRGRRRNNRGRHWNQAHDAPVERPTLIELAERSNAPKVAGRRTSQRVEADTGQRPIPPARQTYRRDRTLGQFG